MLKLIMKYLVNFGEDCPIIDRLYDFVCTYTSASVGKRKLK